MAPKELRLWITPFSLNTKRLYGTYCLDTWKASARSQFLYAGSKQKQVDW